MKRILVAIAAIFIFNIAFSQVKFGVKFGANLASVSDVKGKAGGVSVDVYDNDGISFGFLAGAFTNISFGEFLAFQPELLFSMQGGKQKFSSDLLEGRESANHGMRYKFNYINLPLLLEIKIFDSGLGVLIGPQFGLNVYNSLEFMLEEKSGSEFDNLCQESFGGSPERFDMSLAMGLQYTLDHLIIGLRYNRGLTDHLNTTRIIIDDFNQIKANYSGWKNNVFQLSFSWFF